MQHSSTKLFCVVLDFINSGAFFFFFLFYQLIFVQAFIVRRCFLIVSCFCLFLVRLSSFFAGHSISTSRRRCLVKYCSSHSCSPAAAFLLSSRSLLHFTGISRDWTMEAPSADMNTTVIPSNLIHFRKREHCVELK